MMHADKIVLLTLKFNNLNTNFIIIMLALGVYAMYRGVLIKSTTISYVETLYYYYKEFASLGPTPLLTLFTGDMWLPITYIFASDSLLFQYIHYY